MNGVVVPGVAVTFPRFCVGLVLALASSTAAAQQGLRGESAPEFNQAPGRLYVAEGFERIHLSPHVNSPVIGSIRAGQSVARRSPELIRGVGTSPCTGGWVAID